VAVMNAGSTILSACLWSILCGDKKRKAQTGQQKQHSLWTHTSESIRLRKY